MVYNIEPFFNKKKLYKYIFITLMRVIFKYPVLPEDPVYVSI